MNHVWWASIAPRFAWPFDAAASEPVDADGAEYQRAIAGDEQAWQRVFDRWKRPLLAFFYRSLGSMAEAEDLTLEVFVRLHRAARSYAPRAAFSTFVFHIARNLLLNELRRRRRKPTVARPPEAFATLETPGSGDGRRLAELEELLQQAIAELPEAQRTVLLLIHQQELTPEAAAAVVGVTLNALRVQLHRARQHLRQLLSTRQ